MRIVNSVIRTGLATIGGIGLVLGELDDSPGLGGIGLILIGVSFYLNWRSKTI